MWVIKNQKNHMIQSNITCTSPLKGPHLVQAPEDRDVQMPPYYVKIQWEPVVKNPQFCWGRYIATWGPTRRGCVWRPKKQPGMFVWALSTVVGGLASNPCHGLLKLIVALQIIFKKQYMLCICFPCPHWNANSLSHHTLPFLAVFFCFKPMPCSYLQLKKDSGSMDLNQQFAWFMGIFGDVNVLMFANIFNYIK